MTKKYPVLHRAAICEHVKYFMGYNEKISYKGDEFF